MAKKESPEAKIIRRYVAKYYGIMGQYQELVRVAGLDFSKNYKEIDDIRAGKVDVNSLNKIVTPSHIRSLFSIDTNFEGEYVKLKGNFTGNAAIHAANVIYAANIEYNKRFKKTSSFSRDDEKKVKPAKGVEGDKMLMIMELNRRMPNFIDIYPAGGHDRNRESTLLYEDILNIIDESDCSFDDFKEALDNFLNSKKFLDGDGKLGFDSYRYQRYPDEYTMYVDSFRGNVDVVKDDDDGKIINEEEPVKKPEVISDEEFDSLSDADF